VYYTPYNAYFNFSCTNWKLKYTSNPFGWCRLWYIRENKKNPYKCIKNTSNNKPEGFIWGKAKAYINPNRSEKDKKAVQTAQQRRNNSTKNPHAYKDLRSYYKANPNAWPCACYDMK